MSSKQTETITLSGNEAIAAERLQAKGYQVVAAAGVFETKAPNGEKAVWTHLEYAERSICGERV